MQTAVNLVRTVERIVQQEKTVYGINTGFGKFSDVKIAEQEVSKLQLNLIRSHACGFGEPFPLHVAKAMMVLRLNALLKGLSGIRLEVLERLCYMINEDIIPVIPQQGSLGASGDSGKTASSWYYKIERTKNTISITFYNSNVNEGVPIAIILQYGHGTGTGGWVEGRDYINPAIQPIFDKMAEEAWKEVTNI